MGQRRARAQIIYDVLYECLNGVGVTHLMYGANLSYSTLRKYLVAMSKQGLISKTVGGNGLGLYHTTQKGRVLLDELRNVKDYLNIDG